MTVVEYLIHNCTELEWYRHLHELEHGTWSVGFPPEALPPDSVTPVRLEAGEATSLRLQYGARFGGASFDFTLLWGDGAGPEPFSVSPATGGHGGSFDFESVFKLVARRDTQAPHPAFALTLQTTPRGRRFVDEERAEVGETARALVASLRKEGFSEACLPPLRLTLPRLSRSFARSVENGDWKARLACAEGPAVCFRLVNLTGAYSLRRGAGGPSLENYMQLPPETVSPGHGAEFAAVSGGDRWSVFGSQASHALSGACSFAVSRTDGDSASELSIEWAWKPLRFAVSAALSGPETAHLAVSKQVQRGKRVSRVFLHLRDLLEPPGIEFLRAAVLPPGVERVSAGCDVSADFARLAATAAAAGRCTVAQLPAVSWRELAGAIAGTEPAEPAESAAPEFAAGPPPASPAAGPPAAAAGPPAADAPRLYLCWQIGPETFSCVFPPGGSGASGAGGGVFMLPPFDARQRAGCSALGDGVSFRAKLLDLDRLPGAAFLRSLELERPEDLALLTDGREEPAGGAARNHRCPRPPAGTAATAAQLATQAAAAMQTLARALLSFAAREPPQPGAPTPGPAAPPGKTPASPRAPAAKRPPAGSPGSPARGSPATAAASILAYGDEVLPQENCWRREQTGRREVDFEGVCIVLLTLWGDDRMKAVRDKFREAGVDYDTLRSFQEFAVQWASQHTQFLADADNVEKFVDAAYETAKKLKCRPAATALALLLAQVRGATVCVPDVSCVSQSGSLASMA